MSVDRVLPDPSVRISSVAQMQADFTHLNVIAALVNRFEDWLWKQPRQHEIEAYLATSQNLFELEERIRDLGRATTHLCQVQTPEESSGQPSVDSAVRK